jgi:hypothetical protein
MAEEKRRGAMGNVSTEINARGKGPLESKL